MWLAAAYYYSTPLILLVTLPYLSVCSYSARARRYSAHLDFSGGAGKLHFLIDLKSPR